MLIFSITRMIKTGMEYIEVFKTNICCGTRADSLGKLLLSYFPAYRISFDLEDEDRIMRIMGYNIPSGRIKEILAQEGVECAILE